MEYTGSCLCRDIKFTISSKPIGPHYCYCHMCQKWSGAPVVGWVSFALASLEYKTGKPALYRSSENTQRGFCAKCGSTLFALNDGSDQICMTISALDQKDSIVPEFESFKESSPSWFSCLAKAS